MFVGSSGHAAGKIISFFKMKKSHYSSCQPSSPRSSFPFVLFFASCRFIGHTPFFNLTPVSFFSFLAFCHKQATSQRDYIPPPKQHPSLFPLVVFYLLFLHPPIYPSTPHTHFPPFISHSLVYPCCGLCLPSLSELLSLLSAPLARTKSSSAHSTTKDTRGMKGKELQLQKKENKTKKEAERWKN